MRESGFHGATQRLNAAVAQGRIEWSGCSNISEFVIHLVKD